MSRTTDELFKQFQELQSQRWDDLHGRIMKETDPDILLVDIANMSLALWMQRKLSQLPSEGFKSFNREKK